jgi:hypothetical protein
MVFRTSEPGSNLGHGFHTAFIPPTAQMSTAQASSQHLPSQASHNKALRHFKELFSRLVDSSAEVSRALFHGVGNDTRWNRGLQPFLIHSSVKRQRRFV